MFKFILGGGYKDRRVEGSKAYLNKYKQKIKLISFICCLLRLRSRLDRSQSDWSEHLLAFFISADLPRKSLQMCAPHSTPIPSLWRPPRIEYVNFEYFIREVFSLRVRIGKHFYRAPPYVILLILGSLSEGNLTLCQSTAIEHGLFPFVPSLLLIFNFLQNSWKSWSTEPDWLCLL